MPKAHAPLLLQSDLCRKVMGRVLACVAVMALLVMQAGLVWHGLEHVAKSSSKSSYSLNALSADQSQPASGMCLQCLEDLTHSVSLISHPLVLAASLHTMLQQGAVTACSFATPVELANQRGPPVSLS
jgi:hypothetical protein